MLKSLKSAVVAITLASGLFVAVAQTATPSTPAPSIPAATATCKVAAVNVNTALKVDLQKLPGIGAKMADAIIAARPFKDEADLVKRVKGIGKKNIVTFRPCFLYK